MWPLCTFSLGSALWLLLPLLAGLITGWAIWAGRRSADADLAYAAPEPVRAAAPVAAPAPKVEPVAAPAVKVAPVAVAAAVAMTAIGIPAAIGDPDDLLQIKGVGPKLNDLLNGLGIRRFDQISAWTRGDIGKVDEHLGSFKGRIDRNSWVEQAGLLAKGMISEFEAKFGKLDSENQ